MRPDSATKQALLGRRLPLFPRSTNYRIRSCLWSRTPDGLLRTREASVLIAPRNSPEPFPGQKYIKRCIALLPLGDAMVTSPELFCQLHKVLRGTKVRRDK